MAGPDRCVEVGQEGRGASPGSDRRAAPAERDGCNRTLEPTETTTYNHLAATAVS